MSKNPFSSRPFPGLVQEELIRARRGHGPMASAHEALAVIREEYLEFEQEVFKRTRRDIAVLEELIQLAAMCQRAAEDLQLTEEETWGENIGCENEA